MERSWEDVDAYLEDLLVREDAALAAARESASRTTMPHAAVSPAQGRFLALLAQAAGARRVLELGTLAGYSTIWLARAVGPGGHVTTLEVEERNAAVARENLERAGVAGWADVVVGPAAASAQRLVDDGVAPFDLVFVDADKPGNPRYLRLALELTRPGSLIVVDNVVRAGAVADAASDDPRVVGSRQVLADIAADDRLEATALQTVGGKGWDGFALVRRVR